MRSRFARIDVAGYAVPEQVARKMLSPALVVYLDRIRQNLQRVIGIAGGNPDRWRPHVKTTKISEIFEEMVRAGLRHFKCATTREALRLLEVLEVRAATTGDVLLAHPAIGPALARLGALARKHPSQRLSVLCEDAAVVGSIPSEVSVFVDVNPGMNRTGVPLDVPQTVVEIARRAAGRFRGLHFYDGHVSGTDAEGRRNMAHRGYDRLMELLARLQEAGIEVGEVVTSGTPSFRYALEYQPLGEIEGLTHRVSPGTVVLHDLRTEQELEDLDLLPAAAVFSRVVSRPSRGIATCDAGSKSIAAEAGDPCAFVLGHPHLEALTPSEEHLPLRAEEDSLPGRGTELLLIPRHVCLTVNLADQALLVDAGRVLDVVPVSARAHELWLEEDGSM